MYKYVRAHAPQFIRYLISGGSAAACELGSFQLMLWLWGDDLYFTAAKISGAVGLLIAFLGHKFFAFKKKEQTTKQVIKYSILQGCNYVAQLAMVYGFVEAAGLDPRIAKLLGIAITVLWNFPIYRFLIYV